VPVTVVILTFNEASNIGACLEAIPEPWPVLIVDSGSTDHTCSIAEAAGARVEHRPWSGFADQRNHALAACGVQTPWILFIDADERYPVAFFNWMRVAVGPVGVDAFNVPSTLFLDSRPLRHAPGYPILHPRLVRRGRVRFIANHAGHGEALEPCRVALAPIGYDHFFQDGDLEPWLRKHIGLAALEADAKGIATTRRGRLARWAPAGPALARFAYHYLIRLGFLDGKAGLRYAAMYAWYELAIYLIGASRRVPR
jgi:glycosyltransferase involved in cell wall biosynthesis